MTSPRVRAALHQALDLVLDAIEQDGAGPTFKEIPPAPISRTRRKSARRLPEPTSPVNEVMMRQAAYMLRQKGVI